MDDLSNDLDLNRRLEKQADELSRLFRENCENDRLWKEALQKIRESGLLDEESVDISEPSPAESIEVQNLQIEKPTDISTDGSTGERPAPSRPSRRLLRIPV
jgi:hypothetical protein